MKLSLSCPKCTRILQLPANVVGQAVQCPMCRTVFTAADNSGGKAEQLPFPSAAGPSAALPRALDPTANPPMPAARGQGRPMPIGPSQPVRTNPSPANPTGRRVGLGGMGGLLVFALLCGARMLFSPGFYSHHDYSVPKFETTLPPDFFKDRQFADMKMEPFPDVNLQLTDAWVQPFFIKDAAIVTPGDRPGDPLTLEFNNNMEISGMALSPDERTMVVAFANGKIHKIDLTTGALKAAFDSNNSGPQVVAISSDGAWLASATNGSQQIKIHDLVGETVLLDIAHGGANEIHRGTGSLVFSPKGKTLAAVVDGNVRLWDEQPAVLHKEGAAVAKGLHGPIATPKTVKERDDLVFLSPVLSFAFSPDGALLAVAFQQGSVRVWDLALAKERHVFQTKTPLQSPPVFSPDGNLLAGCVGGNLLIWNLKEGKERNLSALLSTRSDFGAGAFAPDGRTFAAWHDDDTIRLWDVATGAARVHLKHERADKNITPTLVYTKDGSKLISAGGHKVIVADVKPK